MKTHSKYLLGIGLAVCSLITKAQVPFPDLNIPGATYSTGTYNYYNSTAINSPSSGSTTITGSSSTEYKSGSLVKLSPGFTANAYTGSGNFHALISPGDFEAVIMAPTITPGSVGKYEKFEIGLNLPHSVNVLVDNYLSGGAGTKINPYNPDDINVEATFYAPNGGQLKIYGFYFKDFTEKIDSSGWDDNPTNYPWRIRFSPPLVGSWTCSIKVTSPYFSTLNSAILPFTCTTTSNKGYLEIGQWWNQLRYSETHTSFFAMGMDEAFSDHWPYAIPTDPTICNPSKPYEYRKQIRNIHGLHVNGANYFRLVLTPWSEAVEYEKLGDYDTRQTNMWELDKIIDLAHTDDLYFCLCVENHIAYMTSNPWGEPEVWSRNPYNSAYTPANQGQTPGVINPTDCFSDPDAIKFYKRKLRYIISRWGYSTNLASYELFSEVDQVTGYWAHKPEIKIWHEVMSDYIRFGLSHQTHLISTSYAGSPDPNVFASYRMDITTTHSYTNRLIPGANYEDRWNAYHGGAGLDQYNKPFLLGEAGTAEGIGDNCSTIDFHNTIWSTAFMGSYGSATYWFQWGNPSFWSHFRGLSSFMNGEDFESNHYYPQRNLSPWHLHPSIDDGGIESFTLVNASGSRAIGWFQDRYNFWSTQSYCLNQPKSDVPSCTNLVIDNLQPMAKYLITWYTAPGDNPVSVYDTDVGVRAGITGKLRANVYGMVGPGGGSHDYAYKIVKTSDHSFIDPHLIADTLNCDHDTLYFGGVFNDDTTGTVMTYNWDLGNGQFSSSAHPTAYYTTPGTYDVVLILTDPVGGHIDTITQTLYVPTCDTSEERMMLHPLSMEKNTNIISLNPNPNNGSFVLQTDKSINGKMTIYDAKGTVVMDRTIVAGEHSQININLPDRQSGLYFIKIVEAGSLLYSGKFVIN